MSKVLSAHEMEAFIAAGDVEIIDVRDAREFASGHVPGARHVPLEQLRANPAALAVVKAHVIFVCAKGVRSQSAAALAEERGIVKDVYSLEGGTLAWATAGLPIVVPEPPASSQKRASATSSAGADDDENDEHARAGGEEEPALDAIVGANLRELRAKRELTLDALSGAAGVSRALLGQIELGRVAPSIGIVWKIAQALGVPFSTLLRTEGATGASALVLRRATGKRLLSADGRFASRALFPFGEPRKVEFYELWLAPHGIEEAEPHAPGTRENLVIVSGRLELKVGSEVFMLGAGDAVVFTADVSHAYKNPDGVECWMHLVMTYRDAVP